GLGRPANTPRPLWVTGNALPCTGLGALTTRAPNAAPIAWYPRQMPSSGTPAWAQAVTAATLMPASAGAQGPGEITTPAGLASMTCAAVTSSLRTTST